MPMGDAPIRSDDARLDAGHRRPAVIIKVAHGLGLVDVRVPDDDVRRDFGRDGPVLLQQRAVRVHPNALGPHGERARFS